MFRRSLARGDGRAAVGRVVPVGEGVTMSESDVIGVMSWLARQRRHSGRRTGRLRAPPDAGHPLSHPLSHPRLFHPFHRIEPSWS